MRGPLDRMGGLFVLLALAGLGETLALEVETGINGTKNSTNGTNSSNPWSGFSGLPPEWSAPYRFKEERIPIPQQQTPGVETTPAPTKNCSGVIVNGTSCPGDGEGGLSLWAIIGIAAGSVAGAALLAVLIWFLVTKYGPKSNKVSGYTPVPAKPPDPPGAKPADPAAVKVIPVNLVTHPAPPATQEPIWVVY